MKRFLAIVLVGVVAGASAHLGFYSWRRPLVVTQLARDLAWMKAQFNLDDVQYERIRVLHNHTGPELERLFKVLRTTQEEIARLEEVRRATDRVDFIAYHQVTENQRRARLQCRALTLDLVYAVAEVMSPEQRVHYFALVGQGVELGDQPHT
jgi:hypothetical protein